MALIRAAQSAARMFGVNFHKHQPDNHIYVDCFPYSSPFQAGRAVTLTSSCNATSTWLAASTNNPPPVTRGERGR